MKIPTEDFTDVTLAINDTYGDDVRDIVVLVMEKNRCITFGGWWKFHQNSNNLLTARHTLL